MDRAPAMPRTRKGAPLSAVALRVGGLLAVAAAFMALALVAASFVPG